MAHLFEAALGSIRYCARVFDESFFCEEHRLCLKAKSRVQRSWHMKLSQKLAALLLAISALPATSLADDAYQTHCASCHGASGAGNPSLGAPNLTLFSNAYLERQLRGFQERWRDTSDPYTQSMSAAVGALDAGVVAEALLAIDQLPDSREISVAKAAAERHGSRRGLVHCLLWCLSWNKCRW